MRLTTWRARHAGGKNGAIMPTVQLLVFMAAVFALLFAKLGGA